MNILIINKNNLIWIDIHKKLNINTLKKEKLRYLGTVTGTFGYKGEMILSETPSDITNVKAGSIIKIGFSPSFTKDFELENISKKNKSFLIKLKNIESKEFALSQKEKGAYTDEKNIIIDEGESYFIDDLIGCKVYEKKSHNLVGAIKDVLNLPANDVWLVDTKSGELPLPYIKDVVKKIDIENKSIEINLIDGLTDLIKNEKENRGE